MMVLGRKDRETRKKWKGPMRWRKISRALDGDTMVLRCTGVMGDQDEDVVGEFRTTDMRLDCLGEV
jgi:hypothetical protein